MLKSITYILAVLQIIAGFFVLIYNKKLIHHEPISEDNKESQIPLIGVILICLGDIILMIILLMP